MSASSTDGGMKPMSHNSVGLSEAGEVYDDNDYQDKVESQALYDLLEKEIVPTYYDRDRDNRPRNWVARMKAELIALCPQFSINRMVREYCDRGLLPAICASEIVYRKRREARQRDGCLETRIATRLVWCQHRLCRSRLTGTTASWR